MATVSEATLRRLAAEYGLDFPPVVRALSQLEPDDPLRVELEGA